MTSRHRARPITSVIGALALMSSMAMTLQGAFAADQALIDAATKEGQVVWYSSFPMTGPIRFVTEAFEAKYPGITVNVSAMAPADTIQRITDEANAGRVQADVSIGTSNVGPLKAAGLIDCYVPPSAADYPKEYVDADGCWTAEALYIYGIAVNTDQVSEADAPKTLDDLLDPKWKGKLSWTASQGPANAPGFIGAVLESLGEEKGMEYLTKLAAQDVIGIPSNPRAALDQVIAGQFPILLTSINQHSFNSAKDGAPVRWLPQGLIWGGMDAAFVIKNAPHPNAARLFVDFMMSDDGQKAFQAAGSVPASPNVPAASPTLRPDTGGYQARVFSIEEADSKIGHWRDVFDQLFR